MKILKHFLTYSLILISAYTSVLLTQEPVTSLNYNIENKTINEGLSIKYNDMYKLKVEVKNSAKLGLIAKIEQKNNSLKTPDILKPFLSDLLTSAELFSASADVKSLDLDQRVIRMNFINEAALTLYSDTSSLSIYREKASIALNDVIDFFNEDVTFSNYNLSKLKQSYKNYNTIAENKSAEDKSAENEDLKNIKLLTHIVDIEKRALSLEYDKLKQQIIKNDLVPDTSIYRASHIEQLLKKDFNHDLNFLKNSLTADTLLFSEEFKATKDYAKINLKFYDKYSNDTTHKQDLELTVINKWQISFSTGAFINGISQNEYYIENNSDTTSSSNFLKTESTPQIDISFGALANFSYRIKKNFAMGISLGAALSPFDAKTRYLLGPNLIFGNKKQVNLSFGIALGKNNVLSDQIPIKANDEFYSIPKSITTVPMRSNFESSYYFGISYNIISVK